MSSGANMSDPAAAAAAAAAAYELLVNEMTALQHVYFASIGALAWLLYDILLTLEQEVAFIWRARWTFPKVLYLLARYYGLFNLAYYLSVALSTSVGVDYCKRWVWFDAFSNSVFFTTTVNVLFVIRISALFEGKLAMLAFLVFLYISEFVIEVVITVLTLRAVLVVPRAPGLPIRGCSSANAPALTLISWITCLVVASVFWLLTTWRLARNMGVRTWFNVRLVAQRARLYPIMDVFYRDGSLFFGMIFVVILLNTIFNQLGGVYLEIGQPWLSAAYSVAGSRLVLNLKSISATPASARLALSSFAAGSTFRAASGTASGSSGSRGSRRGFRDPVGAWTQSFAEQGSFAGTDPAEWSEVGTAAAAAGAEWGGAGAEEWGGGDAEGGGELDGSTIALSPRAGSRLSAGASSGLGGWAGARSASSSAGASSSGWAGAASGSSSAGASSSKDWARGNLERGVAL